MEGYLGAVAGSPVTSLIDIFNVFGAAAVSEILMFARPFKAIFPDFEYSDIPTEEGIKRLELLEDVQGCISVVGELVAASGLARDDAPSSPYMLLYSNISSAGVGQVIAGPVLVLQGEADTTVPYVIIAQAVNRTCVAYLEAKLEFVTFRNVTHVPVLYAGQRVWLDWIAERFAGVEVEDGCTATEYVSARPYKEYQADGN